MVANPLAFRPSQVTVITAVVYVAVIVALLIVQHTVPAPPSETPYAGVNITEAWLDLKELSNGFHPYNSRRNDKVRDWLLTRIHELLKANGVAYGVESAAKRTVAVDANAPVVVFNDMTSNLTFSAASGVALTSPSVSTYFEGTNIIVYVRGSQDDEGDWWRRGSKPSSGGAMVNAHYDSVSTGFGATDDGVGVITLLQLIKHFTVEGNQPKKGFVALFNNGEEDYLNGARAFGRHPVSAFPRVFLNLEGAGAGGRATLFRATDLQAATAYKNSPHPFGTIVSGDAFNSGFIRSQTDYVVFNGNMGMRGLDVAFMEPRARYHTEDDDARHTSPNSIWHMLSAAVTTMQALTSDTGKTFEGDAAGKHQVPSGHGSPAVWFDVFGKAFLTFELHSLFAVSVSLLVVAPLALILTGAILSHFDKFYLFSHCLAPHPESDHDQAISLHSLRGILRFPTIFITSTAILIGLAFMMTKLNPFIVYSSPYTVWSMMASAWIYCMWFLARATNFIRPTALNRHYALLWLFVVGWILLVIETVYEERYQLALGYPIVWYFLAVSVATLLGFLELFSLPTKAKYAEDQSFEADAQRPQTAESDTQDRPQSSGTQPNATTNGETEDNAEEATESTSLLRGSKTTFARYNRSEHPNTGNNVGLQERSIGSQSIFGDEQIWSQYLSDWVWVFQFLIMAPITTIILGQIGLLLATATNQTLADGSSALLVYVLVALMSVLVFLPLSPFIHRHSYHIPTVLLIVFVGTLIYNLAAFPFSPTSRMKFFFVQRLDLDTGINRVSIAGVQSSFMDDIVGSLPSTAGKEIAKQASSARSDLTEYSWNGIAPRVVPTNGTLPPEKTYSQWLSLNVTRAKGRNSAAIRVSGRNTRSCRIYFDRPVDDIVVKGSDEDPRFPRIGEAGSKELRLWSREWARPWDVTFSWKSSKGKNVGEEGMDGRVVCLWNDQDERTAIPALKEIRRFAPDWSTVTKMGDGLVEGSKSFMI
ncbi:peptidase family M28 family [Apiospora kogelbergensis]|uniref:Peptide hydrolase n=1 Tax=Apiospora kogelbergensis TaxID=1337665 RepID=A0AAW0QEV5_9PEZI